MIGHTLGSYSIQRELGRGGMGAVYVGVHALLGRTAAVKVLLPELSRNQDIVQRFFNEARAATAIRHPGIVEIYDFGYSPDGSAYIVMEYLDGESLSTRLRRLGRLSPAAALGIVRQIAGALAAAHKAGIVHRDLKPDNVFLIPDAETAIGERVKLLDFGIAKLAGDGSSSMARTSTGAIMGTPYYMSPEQCKGAGQVDARSDLYSLGCMLFEMVTGRVPFVGEGGGEIIAAHIHVPAPHVRELAPDVPPEVDALIARLIAKKPEERPQSADALAQEISEVMQRIGAATSAPMTAAQPSQPAMLTPAPVPTTLGAAAGSSMNDLPAKKSRAGLWIALAVLLLGGGALAAFLATRGGDEPHTAAAVSVDAAPTPPTPRTLDGAVALAAPDAAPAALADAAPVVPSDHAKLLEAAQQAVIAENWQYEGELARALLAINGDDADAQKMVDQSDLEGPAQASAQIVLDAQKTHDYEAAFAAFAEIPATSMYKPKTAPVMAALEKQDLADATREITAHVKDHECSQARSVAATESKRWGSAAAGLTKAAKACKAEVASAPPDAGVPTPPNDGTPTFEQLLTNAETAIKSGQYGQGLRLCEMALDLKPSAPKALSACAIAACNLKQADKATEYAGKLKAQRKQMVIQICKRNGIQLPGDTGGAKY